MASLGAEVNETWYAMANAFFFSPEYLSYNRTNAEFLQDLYRTFFNRLPDPSGSDVWGTQLASGMPRENVLLAFMFSPEFTSFTRAIFGSSGARVEVNVVMDFYRGLLSRLPDQAGFNYWVQRLRTAQCAGAYAVNAEADGISAEFLGSAEYRAQQRHRHARAGARVVPREPGVPGAGRGHHRAGLHALSAARTSLRSLR